MTDVLDRLQEIKIEARLHPEQRLVDGGGLEA